MAKGSDNQFPKVLLTPVDPATLTVPSGILALLLDSTDSDTLKLLDDAGTATAVGGGGGGGGQGLVDFAGAKRTAGNVTIASTAFTNVDTGLDLVLTASAGDIIECGLSAQVTSATAQYVVMDFVTVVSGSPVNSVSADGTPSTSASFPTWGNSGVGSGTPRVMFSGSKLYTVQSGDISGGAVTLRLRARSGGTATIQAAGDPLLWVWAKNLGPAL